MSGGIVRVVGRLGVGKGAKRNASVTSPPALCASDTRPADEAGRAAAPGSPSVLPSPLRPVTGTRASAQASREPALGSVSPGAGAVALATALLSWLHVPPALGHRPLGPLPPGVLTRAGAQVATAQAARASGWSSARHCPGTTRRSTSCCRSHGGRGRHEGSPPHGAGREESPRLTGGRAAGDPQGEPPSPRGGPPRRKSTGGTR